MKGILQEMSSCKEKQKMKILLDRLAEWRNTGFLM
jgi:hypothetical protein